MKNKRIQAFIFLCALSLSCQAGGRVSVFEDLLYWHASQQTTSVWAYQFTPVPSNNPADPLTQAPHFTEPNIDFGWNAGVRVGFKYNPESYFDDKLFWTNFSTNANASVVAPPGQVLLTEFFNGFTTNSLYNRANMSWAVKLNMIDLQVGHPFMPLDSLIVHPFFGIKGGTINQSINSSWKLDVLTIDAYDSSEKLINNFTGVGPSFGVDSLWRVYNKLGIRANFATALLWGHWSIQDTFNTPERIFIAPKMINSHTSDSLGSFTASLFLGLEWAFDTKLPVTINAGYEMQFWSNQLRLPLFQALPVHGDLTLQGVTCGIYIDLS